MVPNMLTKQLLKLFGFPFHMAPGEAEAECALLQKKGIVDAVLSEDVDTLMFGCGKTLRNWSSEGTRGNKSPTHVTVYDAETTRTGPSGLDREGMVLIALMSGGDYAPEGIPGCGIKIACEAARAGFGQSLCQLKKSDDASFAAWREHLVHEIHTNESKFFRQKHKSLHTPTDFPNREILGFYTHPVVSSSSKIDSLKSEIVWDGELDVQGLRVFVAEAFEWTHSIGARKFIRGLAPALLVQKLRLRADRRASGYNDLVLTAINEMEYVREICGQRTHFSTDGLPELRVIYHPNDIVGLDLNAELDDNEDIGRDGLATHDEEPIELDEDDESSNRRGPSQYDPTLPDKLWIPRTIAKVGVPLKVEDYEESQRDPQLFLGHKHAVKRAVGKKLLRSNMPAGSMDRFVQVRKPLVDQRSKQVTGEVPEMPTPHLAPAFASLGPTQQVITPSSRENSRKAASQISQASTKIKQAKTRAKSKTTLQPIVSKGNPWTLAQSHTHAQSNLDPLPHITKPAKTRGKQSEPTIVNLLSSSPTQSCQSPSPRKEVFEKRRAKPSTPKEAIRPSHSSILNSSMGEDDGQLPLLPDTVTRMRGSRPLEQPLSLSSSDEEHNSDQDSDASPRKRRSLSSVSSPLSARSTHLQRSDASKSPTRCSDLETSKHQSRLLSENLSPPSFSPTPQKPSSCVIDLSSSPPSISPTESTPIHQQPTSTNHLFSPISATNAAKKEQTKKKKTILMLRESYGGFQELDEEEWEVQRNLSGSSTMYDMSKATEPTRRGRRAGRERKAFRISQVEVLDLRG